MSGNYCKRGRQHQGQVLSAGYSGKMYEPVVNLRKFRFLCKSLSVFQYIAYNCYVFTVGLGQERSTNRMGND
jgi:hypothetical protein